MPFPKTTDVGKVMKFLKKDKPKMKRKQMIAISLDVVRRAQEKRGGK